MDLNRVASDLVSLEKAQEAARQEMARAEANRDEAEQAMQDTIHLYLASLGYNIEYEDDGSNDEVLVIRHNGKEIDRGFDYGGGEMDAQVQALQHAGKWNEFQKACDAARGEV